MAVCPHCRTILTAADLQTGQCPLCSGNTRTETERELATANADAGGRPPEISPMWAGKYDAAADPRASIGGKGSFAAGGPDLAIHPRVLAESQAAQHSKADYELKGLLGRGGMGVVLAARQASIDRVVALKKINPSHAEDSESRRKFLTEAVVTGDLEHPNIVPIYDLGKDESGTLFYAMKHVKGTPWDKVLPEKSLAENLEVFMKVADAVAFAHSRNVVHRDLKPENVMLGGYGEVLVMDWGLAIKVGTPAAAVAGVGGTPAYMAPEMMTSRPHEIGPASDIYLLGAILYEIITGKAPHTGPTVQECLLNVLQNTIVPTERDDELVTIALKAMATQPADRYASAGELQEAIRQYQSHSQSVLLSSRAEEDLKAARGREDYEFYARALFGFQEAYELWEGNTHAWDGILQATLSYADRAMQKGDYDLGRSLLDEKVREHEPLLKQIVTAHRDRDARIQRLKTARRIGAALLLTVLAVVSVAFFWIRAEKNLAQTNEREAIKQEGIAKTNAEEARKNAEEATKQEGIAKENATRAKKNAEIAQKNASEAKRQEGIAKTNEATAVHERELAQTAKEKEAYGAYIARIGLASAKIDENAFDMAGALLAECPQEFRNWEWGRLMHLCRQSDRTIDVPERVEALALSPDGKRLVTGGVNSTAQLWDAENGRLIVQLKTGAQNVFAAAFSPDGRQVALGTNDSPAYLKVFDAGSGRLVWEYRSHQVPGKPVRGHEDAVVSVAWSRDGKRLLTSSYDKTARLWDVAAGEELRVFRGHDWWVWSAAFSPDEKWVVTASQDGSAIVWDTDTAAARATFRGHVGAVYAAAFAPSAVNGDERGGQTKLPHALVASAGYDKRILLWSPDALQDFDYRALTRSEDGVAAGETSGPRAVLSGHTAAVRALGFSPDGHLLASASYDNSVRVWNVDSRQLVKTLRGHGGRVCAVAFGPQPEGEGRRLFSAGHDQRVKVWDLHRYEEMRVIDVARGEGHRDAVLGATFSRNGDRIVTASRDRTARTWDRFGRSLVEFKEGHEYLASTTAFFPDGKRLLTAAVDSTVRIWDLTTDGQIAVFKKTGPSAAAAISHDGRWVLTGGDAEPFSAGPVAQLMPAARGSESPRQAAIAGLVARVSGSFRPLAGEATQGRALVRLVSAEPVWPAKLWDAGSGKIIHTLAAHHGEVTAVAFSPDDSLLFTGDANGRGHVWDRQSGDLRNGSQKLHSRGITAAEFIPRTGGLLTASGDNTVAQWAVTRQEDGYVLALRRELHHPDVVSSMAVAADGKHVLTTCSDRIVRLWDLATAEQVAMILPDRDHRLRMFDIGAAAEICRWRDGELARIRRQRRQLLEDKANPKPNVAALDANTKKLAEEELTILGREEINSVAFSASGDTAATTATDGTVRLWDWASGREIGSGSKHAVPAFRSDSGQAWSSAFSANGACLVTVGGSDARLWDRSTGRETMRFGPQGAVASARFSPDGNRVVTASWDNAARLWNATTGQVELKLQGHTGYVNEAVFSRDGARVLTASDDKTARLWDAKRGEVLVVFQGHTQRLRSADLDCDPASGKVRKVVTASDDGSARIWDANGRVLHELKGHDKAVLSAVFSDDGTRVLTGGDDNRAIVWDSGSGKKLLVLEGHTAGVTAVAFSPDGRRALTGSRDNTVKAWELKNGKELLTLKGHTQEVTAVSFSPDQHSVLTAGLDGIWILWDAATWQAAPP